MEKFIYIKENSISKEICDLIIKLFEENNYDKYKGIVSSGLNLDLKDTFDLQIPNNNHIDYQKWKDIKLLLENELNYSVKNYIQSISNNIHKDLELFKHDYVSVETFQIQKYIKNNGKFNYHDDFSIDFNEKKYRVITYIFYLNNIDIGGETEIWGYYKIKPKVGQLLLFPACWTFPHAGLIPKSHHKYIITGWLYIHR